MNSSEPRKDRFAPLTYEQMYGVEEPEPDGRPLELEIDSLVPFPNQPFNPYKETEMEEMVESIKENGVISPIIVRPKADGETYEIISGHNRVEACRRAGICQVPSFIRDVDDDTAVILMVDSNLRQREKPTEIEKARAFEMKLEAIKRQGARTDLTSSQLGMKLKGMTSFYIMLTCSTLLTNEKRPCSRIAPFVMSVLVNWLFSRTGHWRCCTGTWLARIRNH